MKWKTPVKKKKEIVSFVTPWVELEDVVSSERC